MHEGHRSRLVGKVKDGSSLYDHELMEVLLFNACPRKDMNGTAHAVLSEFGSLEGVLKADVESLLKVDGVGRNMAEYLAVIGKALPQLNGCKSFTVLKNTREFKEFLSAMPVGDREEVVFYLVDKEGRVKRICRFYAEDGKLEKAQESKLVKLISVYNPYGIFTAFRRISEHCTPSPYDDFLVKIIDDVSHLCGCKFFDYCIVSPQDEIYSYFVADRGVFSVHDGTHKGGAR